jgi:hypothetical protein
MRGLFHSKGEPDRVIVYVQGQEGSAVGSS